MSEPRVIIIGLDSVPPRLAFEVLPEAMPFFKSLVQGGLRGPLISTTPPITVPAWACMTSGRDPGELGVYGFRNRRARSYEMSLASSDQVGHPRIWDIASARGLSSAVVSVPLTYPLKAPRNAVMTGCLMTPGPESAWAAPANRRAAIEARFGPYLVDVEDFRADEKARIVEGCRRLTLQHFGIFRHLIESESPDFAMIVDLAPDRLHHGLLAAVLPEHPDHEANRSFEEMCLDYYRLLDREIERTLNLAGPRTLVMIVSDHGVQPLEGAVCINEWLAREGYLTLLDTPEKPTPLSMARVDWSRTKAWGEGGHHGRICFNVKGREPAGIVPMERLAEEKAELADRIRSLVGPSGEALANEVFDPSKIYAKTTGLPPDLLVYWSGLKLRSVGTVGHRAVHLRENDTGPDQANHARMGICVLAGDGVSTAGEAPARDIREIFTLATDALLEKV